ncbi:MAG: SCO family protein [Planctomycetota bacterium]
MGSTTLPRGRLPRLLLALLIALAPMPMAGLSAQSEGPLLREARTIDITEHPDAQVPLDLEFRDEAGETVRLGALLEGERPVVLNLVYFTCPGLCNLVLDGLAEALRGIDWSLGEEYEVLTVSIDPRDTPEGARSRKELLLEGFRRPGAEAAWHFLTGEEPSIRALADTVGFGYKWVEKANLYAHGAVIMVLTPEGRVSRYLYGVQYDPRTLRLSLVEASEGKVGSTLDKLFLLCFHYDPSKSSYGPTAMMIARIGGGITVLAIAGLIFFLRRRERHARSALSAGAQT